jgi:glycerol-3-phosphate dehydrogenase
MQRNVDRLKTTQFDVVIIGGGIFGSCAAWDAALRGLSVALIERDDFCSGSSANSFKMIHGGIRYLQHADIERLRYSCNERSAFLRIAPHLVTPLPIFIPTYGYGKKGKFFLGVGMLIYDLLTLGRNSGIKDKTRRIPWTRFFSRAEAIDSFPDLDKEQLTGAAMFCDGQMYNPTRLALSFVKSAAEKEAVIANYIEAIDFITQNNKIDGVKVKDRLSGKEFTIKAKTVLNAAGPWAERLLNSSLDLSMQPPGVYSRDACFVVKKKLTAPYALAIQGRTKDPDALLSRPARHLFLVPWRDYTLVGVWHVVFEKHPDEVTVTAEDLQTFIDEINWAFPSMNLTLADVTMWNAGLVPFGENEPEAENLSYGKRSKFVDHGQSHNLDGLVTLIGIRYTTARGDAAHALDVIQNKLNQSVTPVATDYQPIYGGDFENFENLVSEIKSNVESSLNEDTIRALAHNYGAKYQDVLEYGKTASFLLTPLENTTTLKAEIIHAMDREMAVKLSDVVFRRTDMATGSNPGDLVLLECAKLMADKLGWDEDRIGREIQEVKNRFPKNVN